MYTVVDDLIQLSLAYLEKNREKLTTTQQKHLLSEINILQRHNGRKTLRGHFVECSWSRERCCCGPDTCECVIFSSSKCRLRRIEQCYSVNEE